MFGTQNMGSLEDIFKFLGNPNFTTYFGREGLKNYSCKETPHHKYKMVIFH